MKQLLLSVTLFLVAKLLVAQNNPCNMQWGNWESAYSASSGTLYYAVQFSKCTSDGGICGWPKIGLRHTFPYDATISLRLRGYGCDGKEVTASFSGYKVQPNSDYKDQGNWHIFKSVTEILRVEINYTDGNNDYRFLFDREKGINETYVNGKTKSQIETERKEQLEQQQKEQKEKEEADKKEKEEQLKDQEKEKQSNDAVKKENDPKTNSNTSNTTTKEKSPEELLAEAKAAHFKSEMDLRKSSQENADQENQSKLAYFSSVFGDFNFKGANPLKESNYMMNLSIGVPAGNVPLYTNSNLSGSGLNSNSSSVSTASSLFGYYFGGELHLLNNKFIDLRGFGSYYGSITSIGGTTDGSDDLSQFYYGGELGIGYKRLKFYGGYAKGNRAVNSYSHTYNEYLDADFTTSGSAYYNFTRYIGGICYHFDDSEKERSIRINFIKETPDYNKTDFIWGAGLAIRGWLTIEGEFFPSYPGAGSYNYNLTDNSKKSLWQVCLSKTVTLFNGRY